MTTESLSRWRQTGPSDRQSTLVHSHTVSPNTLPLISAHPLIHPPIHPTGRTDITAHNISQFSPFISHQWIREKVSDRKLLPPGTHKEENTDSEKKFTTIVTWQIKDKTECIHMRHVGLVRDPEDLNPVPRVWRIYHYHQHLVNEWLKPFINIFSIKKDNNSNSKMIIKVPYHFHFQNFPDISRAGLYYPQKSLV